MSYSTLSLAPSMPVGVGESSNISRTKSVSTLSLVTATSVGVSKSSNISRTKSASTLSPVGIERYQSPAVGSADEGGSILGISLSETYTAVDRLKYFMLNDND